MKFESTEVFNLEGALRGMRNPMNSWDKSDSGEVYENRGGYAIRKYAIGKSDLTLAQALIRGGSDHRKFMRQIFVSVDITAPLYWWKEFDTYKVGTVAVSTSTMHKLASTPITKDCFEMDDAIQEVHTDLAFYGVDFYSMWISLIDFCENLRQKYNETKDKCYWKELIRLLPESWLQKRTVTMNYENLLVICSRGQRRFHKLTEWSKSFITWARTLPYAQELIFIDEYEQKEEKKNDKGTLAK